MRFLDFLWSMCTFASTTSPKCPLNMNVSSWCFRLAETCPKSQTLEFRPTFKLKYAFFFFFLTWCSVLIIKSTKPSSFDFIFNYVCERQRWSAIQPSCTYRWPRHPGVTSAWAKLEKFYFYTNDLYLFKKKNHSILNISFYYLTIHEVIYLSEYSF